VEALGLTPATRRRVTRAIVARSSSLTLIAAV